MNIDEYLQSDDSSSEGFGSNYGEEMYNDKDTCLSVSDDAEKDYEASSKPQLNFEGNYEDNISSNSSQNSTKHENKKSIKK